MHRKRKSKQPRSAMPRSKKRSWARRCARWWSYQKDLSTSSLPNYTQRMWKEFKEFAIKGNAVDLAVGVIIGAAFGGIINSLVKDIIMPPVSLLAGGLDFSNKFIVLRAAKDGSIAFNTAADAAKAGAITLNYGNFITLIINFLIVAGAIFLLVG